jgi:hypothetical protein
MKLIFYSFMLLCSLHAACQKNKQLSVAFLNAGTATPFSQFGKLITKLQHPGVEIGYTFNWNTKKKHDWRQEIKLNYFYHRFVQHAISLYSDLAYVYKFSPKWTMQAAVGAGYMHSIPATAQLKLGDNGEYKNGKAAGRMQLLGAVNFSVAHILDPNAAKPIALFITYQQMLQTQFIHSYVPLLPYNNLLLGISIRLRSNKN